MNDPWRHRSDEMKCKTCMWFSPKLPGLIQQEIYAKRLAVANEKGNDAPCKPKAFDLGRCRRRCPTMNGFPVVFVNDWCGDHKLNEDAL